MFMHNAGERWGNDIFVVIFANDRGNFVTRSQARGWSRGELHFFGFVSRETL
jgi:hypothetical protein